MSLFLEASCSKRTLVALVCHFYDYGLFSGRTSTGCMSCQLDGMCTLTVSALTALTNCTGSATIASSRIDTWEKKKKLGSQGVADSSCGIQVPVPRYVSTAVLAGILLRWTRSMIQPGIELQGHGWKQETGWILANMRRDIQSMRRAL